MPEPPSSATLMRKPQCPCRAHCTGFGRSTVIPLPRESRLHPRYALSAANANSNEFIGEPEATSNIHLDALPPSQEGKAFASLTICPAISANPTLCLRFLIRNSRTFIIGTKSGLNEMMSIPFPHLPEKGRGRRGTARDDGTESLLSSSVH